MDGGRRRRAAVVEDVRRVTSHPARPRSMSPASPPTIAPIVAVPCPLRSVGSWVLPIRVEPGVVPPRQGPARSGWVASTPESRLATTTPCPCTEGPQGRGVYESDVRSLGADDSRTLGAGRGRGNRARGHEGDLVGGDACDVGPARRSPRSTAGVAVTEMPLKIQNSVAGDARPVVRGAETEAARSGGWDGRRMVAQRADGGDQAAGAPRARHRAEVSLRRAWGR